jgi:NADPH:quinone reductase-like Zn-dependent oxidoreductase
MTDQAAADDHRVTPSTARSIWIDRFGPVDALAVSEQPIPQPVDDEVLVRVRAASINPVDIKTAEGIYPFRSADEHLVVDRLRDRLLGHG